MSRQLNLFEPAAVPRAHRLVRMGVADAGVDHIRLRCATCGFDAGWQRRADIKFFGIDADTICPACNPGQLTRRALTA